MQSRAACLFRFMVNECCRFTCVGDALCRWPFELVVGVLPGQSWLHTDHFALFSVCSCFHPPLSIHGFHVTDCCTLQLDCTCGPVVWLMGAQLVTYKHIAITVVPPMYLPCVLLVANKLIAKFTAPAAKLVVAAHQIHKELEHLRSYACELCKSTERGFVSRSRGSCQLSKPVHSHFPAVSAAGPRICRLHTVAHSDRQ